LNPPVLPLQQKIKLLFAYQGSSFLGWQKTPHGKSIEEELERAFSQILRHSISFSVASRTDAGVHAEGQIAHFCTHSLLSLQRIHKSANALLPKEISILLLERVPPSFHATLDCRRKEYHYALCLNKVQLPFHRNFSWHFPHSIDLNKMQKAAAFLIGKHDFSAFTSEEREDYSREIFAINFESLPYNRLIIKVMGDNFLYRMVRNIVGTLLYIGTGKLSEISSILESRDRTKAGVTAPAHGLILKQVFYDP